MSACVFGLGQLAGNATDSLLLFHIKSFYFFKRTIGGFCADVIRQRAAKWKELLVRLLFLPILHYKFKNVFKGILNVTKRCAIIPFHMLSPLGSTI